MGHLSHPVGLRLGVSRRWPMKGISRFQSLCEELSILLFRVFTKKYTVRLLQKNGLLYSHALVNFSDSHGKANFKIFLYDSLIDAHLFRIYKRFRKRRWRHRLYDLKSLFKFSIKPFYRYMSFANKNLVRGYKHLRIFLFHGFQVPVHRFLFKSLLAYLSYRIFKFNITPHVSIFFCNLASSNLTARSLAVFAIRKLRSKNRLNDIFKPLLRGFKSITDGFRVLCVGRYTKRQRASSMMYRAGRTPHSSFATPIDFYFTSVPLKYGVGSMKIWITRLPIKNLDKLIERFLIEKDLERKNEKITAN